MPLRAVIRQAWREPWRSGLIVAALTLSASALGVTGELLRTLILNAAPYANSHRVVVMQAVNAQTHVSGSPIPQAILDSLGSDPFPFIATAKFSSAGVFRSRADSPRDLPAQYVDASLFELLGVAPIL